MSKKEGVVAVVSYPLIILLSFVLHYILQPWVSVEIAAYLAVLFGALCITVHEWKVPYRTLWHPTGPELANDTAYMVLGQVMLERVLTGATIFAITLLTAQNSWQISQFWPHEWPILVQTALMLAVGDFFRYWLHRGFHRFAWMWRFHAVHHSPERLYWINVGRFHPIEQGMQFLVDALPFILLGVSTEVLSAYFVFYAVNGFFQHSNCLVKLGPLNWIVAGPELHRWHHSVIPEESNHNFGNNLIIWDIIFGTRLCPVDRKIGPLGIPVKGYPQSFLRQLVAPFDPRISMNN